MERARILDLLSGVPVAGLRVGQFVQPDNRRAPVGQLALSDRTACIVHGDLADGRVDGADPGLADVDEALELADGDDARLRHREAAGTVQLEVVTDRPASRAVTTSPR